MEIEAFSRIQAYVEQVATYSTKFGVAWIFGTIVFRIMPAIAFMDGVYADDQEVFQCVTTQPGCNQMCFNQFSPILPHRLYLLHITLLMLPIFAFLTWAISFENRSSREENELKMLEKSMLNGETSSMDATSLETEQYYKRLKTRKQKRKTKNRIDITKQANVQIYWSPRVRLFYILHVITRLAMELVFFYTTYLLQTYQTKKTGFFDVWFVPDTYDCTYGAEAADSTNACSQDRQIPCWVSRPAEKSLFVLYMVAVQIFCCILGILDIMFVFIRSQRKRLRAMNRVQHDRHDLMHRNSHSSLLKNV